MRVRLSTNKVALILVRRTFREKLTNAVRGRAYRPLSQYFSSISRMVSILRDGEKIIIPSE